MKKIAITIILIASAYALQAQKVKEYTAMNGTTYKVNQTIFLAVPADGENFTSITNTSLAAMSAFTYDNNTDTRVSGSYAGAEVPIKKIKLRKVFGKKRAFISIGKSFVIDLEAAIKLNEIEHE